MILFFHGLYSTGNTNKFTSIGRDEKISKTVQYQHHTYEQISEFYDGLIKDYKVKLLVGHSLGGYWALTKSNDFMIPCVVLNPVIKPSEIPELTNLNYIDLEYNDMDYRVKRGFHIEMGDERLDMNLVKDFAKNSNSISRVYKDGRHRIKHLSEIDKMIDKILDDDIGGCV